MTRLIGVKVSITRYVIDDPQPGLVECGFLDARGRYWTFIEKTAIVSDEDLHGESVYPMSGVIACEIVGHRRDTSNPDTIVIDTERPWGVESVDKETRFEVLPGSLVQWEFGTKIVQDWDGNIITLTEDSLIPILKDERQRALLLGLLREEPLTIGNQIRALSSGCVASPNDLSELFEDMLLVPENQSILAELVFHPEMPEQLLLHLAGRNLFISELGHRRGPRKLLEYLAEEYKYDEAITTLALRYYAKGPFNEFLHFTTKHKGCWMMGLNLAISLPKLSSDKSTVVKELFQSEFPGIFAKKEILQALSTNPSDELLDRCVEMDDKYIHEKLLDVPDLPHRVLEVLSEKGKTKTIRRKAEQRLAGKKKH